MLKYKDITEQLSVKQKIALLTNVECLSDPVYNQYGIPCVNIDTVRSILKEIGEGISPVSLARSWNTELIEDLIGEIAMQARCNDTHLLLVPTSKIKLDIYDIGTTEDPMLSAALTASYLKAVYSSGLTGGIDEFFFKDAELEFLDPDSRHRVIKEYFVKPFQRICRLKSCKTVLGTVYGPFDTYNGINRSLLVEELSTLFSDKIYALCSESSSKGTLSAIGEGCIVFHGVASALEDAYEEYLRIQSLIEAGHASIMELEDACENGAAITPAMLDAAVDRVIEFAFSLQPNSSEDTVDVESYNSEASNIMPKISDAMRQSIVLLKNENNILPLQEDNSIAIIGDISMLGDEDTFAKVLSDNLACNCIGMARGYNDTVVLEDAMIEKAVNLASEADRVLLFIGAYPETKESRVNNLYLPPQQLALLDSLKEYKDKIIAVLVSDLTVDMRFDKYVSGLLLAHIGGKLSADALTDILMGKYSPSGRLTESYYDDPDGMFPELVAYKKAKGNKIGPFLGYRHYDSENLSIRYPFGYGLSYTSFSYSNIRLHGDEIRFVVENTGHVIGREIVQVYIGLPNSKLIRPNKELKAFLSLELSPKEKKEVVIRDLDLNIFDDNENAMIIEDGEYCVSVGASLQDIRLQTTYRVSGKIPKDNTKNRSDYLQSISNIVSDEYTLEAENTKMKKYWGWSLAGCILIVAALLLDIAVILIEFELDIVLGIINLIMIALCVTCFLIEKKLKKRQRKRIDAEERKKIKKLFENAENLDTDEITDLFVNEFDLSESVEVAKEEIISESDDAFLRINRVLDFEVLAENLVEFAAERGISITRSTAAATLASFASSRLIFVNSLHGDELNQYLSTLSEYFDSQFYSETIFEEHHDFGHLLFVKDENGNKRTTALMKMISHAKEEKSHICFAVFNQVRAEAVADLFLPYIRYFDNPNRENKVVVKEMSEEYTLPENIWFVVDIAAGEALEDIPSHLFEKGTLLSLNYVPCEAREEKKETHALTYTELIHIVDQTKNKLDIQEDIWKKVDSLEGYVNEHVSYQIGNKLSLQMEKYLSVYSACGLELNEAWDRTMAANLLPMMMSALKNKVNNDERSLLEIVEQIFGEDNVEMCRKVLKNIAV